MSEANVRDILKRVEKLRLADLDGSILDSMGGDLSQRREGLARLTRSRDEALNVALKGGDFEQVSRLRMEIRQSGREHEELTDELQRVRDARQESKLSQTLRERLGGQGRVWFLEWSVFVLIILVLGLLFYEFTHPDLDVETRRLIFWTDTVCCFIFLGDFFFRLWCADSKTWFWRRYWIDFITSIPLPDAQLLRFGRAARLARVMRIARVARFARLLRFFRLVAFLWRGMDKLHQVLDIRLFRRSLLLGLAILFGGAWLMYTVEGGKHPEVGSFWQSVWWSFTTVVTGGFGDIYNPVSPTGRVLTVFLIIAGMVVVGVFTATLTSILVGDESEQIALMQKSLEEQLEELGSRMSRIEEALGVKRPSEKPD